MGDFLEISANGIAMCRPQRPSLAETMYGMARRNAEKKAERIALMQLLGEYLDREKISLQELADRINETGGDDAGKPIDRKRAWNYVNKTPMLDWLKARLDDIYPEWQVKPVAETSRQDSRRVGVEWSGVPRRDMPVIAPIEDKAAIAQMLEAVRGQGWDGRSSSAPDYLNAVVPMQPIRSNRFSPVFELGDAVGILPVEEAHFDRLYVVTDPATGLSDYAALVKVDGIGAWVTYEGEVIPYESRRLSAAVVVHLLEFSSSSEDGVFSRLGLRVGRQVLWPRKS